MADGFIKVVRRISFYAGLVGMIVLLIGMVLTTFDVIGRKVFNLPIPGAVELGKMVLAIFVLLGLAYTQQLKGHVSIDILTPHMSLRTQHILNIITTLLSLFIFAFLIWQGWIETVLTMKSNTVSDVLRIPIFLFKSLVSVGVFLLCLELICGMIIAIEGLVRGKKTSKEVVA